MARLEGDRTRGLPSVILVAVLVLALSIAMTGIVLAARVRVRASGEAWRPAHLFIDQGDTVVWKNPGGRRHNVVAYGGGWRFRETLDPGDSARRVFDQARTEPFRYRCTIHSALVQGRCEGMCGLIHVFTA